MCQLLGMNCNVPTDICFSFEGFHVRGGMTDHHKDGWGIAFFEGPGCRLFIDSKATIESPVADLVRRYPIRSRNVIAHIRKSTQGHVALENCHPFQRELWGRYWIFAHNGNLEGFAPLASELFRPVGQTDSEQAFCYIMGRLRESFPATAPNDEQLFQMLQEITLEITSHGLFNYLLSNGDTLFAHCSNNLHYIIRQSPFGDAHLIDQDISMDFSRVTGADDKVAVIASFPLTDNEVWTAMAPGELLMFRDGEPAL
jgi:predicted glutamine amidotransferase